MISAASAPTMEILTATAASDSDPNLIRNRTVQEKKAEVCLPYYSRYCLLSPNWNDKVQDSQTHNFPKILAYHIFRQLPLGRTIAGNTSADLSNAILRCEFSLQL